MLLLLPPAGAAGSAGGGAEAQAAGLRIQGQIYSGNFQNLNVKTNSVKLNFFILLIAKKSRVIVVSPFLS